MRTTLPPLIPFALLTAACGGGMQHDVHESPLVQDVGTLQFEQDGVRREFVLELPPVALPAQRTSDGSDSAIHEHDAHVTDPYLARFPIDGWLHGYTVEIVDGRGARLPQQLLHHVNLIAPDRRELFSPIMQRIGAAGTETAPVRLPRLIGMPVQAGERVLVRAMLHNPTSTDHDGARLRIRLHYSTPRLGFTPLEVFPFYLDVMPPAGTHAFDLPPGTHTQSWQGRPAVAARVLGLGGHVHRYAEVLRFEDVTAKRVLWESRPRFDEDGEVAGMPQSLALRGLGLGIPLDPAHVYRLSVTYHNPTGDTIRAGGMGALGGIVRIDGRSSWPAVEPGDANYRLDVAVHASPMNGTPSAESRGGAHVHPTSRPVPTGQLRSEH